MTKLKSVFGLASLVCFILAFVGCSAGFDVKKSAKIQDLPSLSDSEPPPVADGQKMTFLSMQAAELDLAEKQTISGTVQSLESFAGTLQLSLDRSALDLIDKEQNIKITITPSSINLTANQTATFSVEIESQSMAPSFAASMVKIIADDGSNSSVSKAEITLNLRVNPVVTLKMLGGNDPLQRWDRPSRALSFRDHSDGLTVQFVNFDTNGGHVVHGTGAIPHGNVGSPLAAPATAGQAGGVYMVNIDPGTVDSGTYYFHDLGPDGDERDINFGVASSVAAAINSQKVSAAVSALESGQREPAKTGPCP